MENVIAPGAQTVRRDDAGPVSALLGGYASLAACLGTRQSSFNLAAAAAAGTIGNVVCPSRMESWS